VLAWFERRAETVGGPRVRIVDAALRCIERTGLAKMTMDDVAAQAGLSRATVYRTFAGGKDELLRAVVETEAARLVAELAVAMGEADDLRAVLIAGITTAARRLRGHGALRTLLELEPGTVLARLAFGEADRLLVGAGELFGPFLARWLEPEHATRVAEWATRVVLSYLLCPSREVDLEDAARVGRLVDSFLLPVAHALASEGSLRVVEGGEPPCPATRRGAKGGLTHAPVADDARSARQPAPLRDRAARNRPAPDQGPRAAARKVGAAPLRGVEDLEGAEGGSDAVH
jgi:AcrR family transcriptional regulator